MALVLALATVAWVALLVVAPLLPPAAAGLGAAAYAVGALICHQLPDRSFHLAGAQLPVCARCAGLYAGAALGACGWLIRSARPRAPWPMRRVVAGLVLAGTPTAVTVATAMVGLLDPPNLWRAALAVPLGATGGVVAGAVASRHLK
ncbi:MAG: DUF2085 domain-containing protein [Vicinamibacterales bacterium]